jgi:hypothetical protein
MIERAERDTECNDSDRESRGGVPIVYIPGRGGIPRGGIIPAGTMVTPVGIPGATPTPPGANPRGGIGIPGGGAPIPATGPARP